ncbi:hypothetical protein JXD20_00370 [Candidatus Peregrinibacteria bacterium]|nr:hypothetical protein [Candidatus Peregrinibacteria bacterium]
MNRDFESAPDSGKTPIGWEVEQAPISTQPVTLEQESGIARSRIGKALAILGLSGALLVGAEGGRESLQKAYAESAKAEITPDRITAVHERLSQEVKADEIARVIAGARESTRVQLVENLEEIFGEDRADGNELIIDGKGYHVKVGSSSDQTKYYTVIDRTHVETTNPHLVGMSEKNDVTPEEGRRLALENAADNLR